MFYAPIFVINVHNIYFILFSVLQMTDVELEERVTALEENGGGSVQNGNYVLTFECLSFDRDRILDLHFCI